MFLRLLATVFKFHPWHADAPTSARPYRHLVARIVNDLKPTAVVEVGCGLGAILRLVTSAELFGFDIDEGAIRAARFLSRGNITFLTGGLDDVSVRSIDVLILINWIHEISPKELDRQLSRVLPFSKYILLDALDAGEPGYNHNFEFLKSRATLLSVNRPNNERRSFQLFKVLSE